MQNLLIVIPARAGSKGLIHKNRKRINNKSLFILAIEFSLEIKKALNETAETFIVPATDDPELTKQSLKYDLLKYKRPVQLSGDEANLTDLIFDVLHKSAYKKLEIDWILILQPTSPQRTLQGFVRVWDEMLKTKNYATYVSVSPTPFKKYELFEKKGDKLVGLHLRTPDLRRQEFAEDVYYEDGAFYLIKKSEFISQMNTQPTPRHYIKAHDDYIIDIDNNQDFVTAKALIEI